MIERLELERDFLFLGLKSYCRIMFSGRSLLFSRILSVGIFTMHDIQDEYKLLFRAYSVEYAVITDAIAEYRT